MWELICHHTYRLSGAAVDLSIYDSHGEPDSAPGFSAQGATPGSGAVRFNQPGMRIRIPMDAARSPAWRPLGGVKVEVLARLVPLSPGRRTLIAGDGAFTFFVSAKKLFASFVGKSTFPMTNSDGLDSYADTLDFQPYSLPMGQWATFGFLHDGLDTMELSVNGEVIARRTMLRAGIPNVGPKGVSIGNSPVDDHQFLDGEIDEIKVWRLDPRRIRRDFLGRPFDEATADCWERYFRCIHDALVKDPDCAQLLTVDFPAALDDLVRRIVAKGPESRERYAATCEQYTRLWRAGRLDSPQMAQLFADWCTWLRLSGISLDNDPTMQSILNSPCLEWVRDQCKGAGIECDPQAAAMVKSIADGCGQTRAAAV